MPKPVLLFFFMILGMTKLFAQPENAFFELKKGDILIRPNNNWIPGTEFVRFGNNFGHAAIVVNGARGKTIEEVLKKAYVFESNSRDISPEFQLRTIHACQDGDDLRFANDSFCYKYRGKRYRLRAQLTNDEINRIIEFVLRQDNDVSAWRSKKNISKVSHDKSYWYCTLLIYQAFKCELNLDIDANGGIVVFPNDIITHPIFDHEDGRLAF